jgi:DNA-binding transcriptional ArsR family regulator
MPSKTIASILNNESNLRILEKLKMRPFYPRELAGEMGLSEPFIVRRLKAMEEFDIVEGRWETEKNGRKVKRYYVKDIKMELGKDGLKVTSGDKTEMKTIDPGREAVRFLVALPIIVFVASGFFFAQPVILAISCMLFLWQLTVCAAMYRTYRHKSTLTAIVILTVGIVSTLTFIWLIVMHNKWPAQASDLDGAIYFCIGLVFFYGLVKHIQFSQIEEKDMLNDNRELIESLDTSSIPVKIFYLPFVVRWRLKEYFGLQ